MSEIAINSSQNVKISFRTASVGERIIAFLIDGVVKVAYIFLLIFILESLSKTNVKVPVEITDTWEVMAIIGILMLPVTLYHLVSEILMEGQTLGKKIMKIKVIKIDGYQASVGDYFMRWLLSIVDFTSVGVIVMILSKRNQRIGDMVAGTGVISLKNQYNLSHTILEELKENYQPMFPQVVALSDNDMRIIKENYRRAAAVYDKQIIHSLANKIKEILKIQMEHIEITEKQFIEIIIKDYNYFTGKE